MATLNQHHHRWPNRTCESAPQRSVSKFRLDRNRRYIPSGTAETAWARREYRRSGLQHGRFGLGRRKMTRRDWCDILQDWCGHLQEA